MNDMPDAPTLDGMPIADLGEQLNQLLRLPTYPIGMKLFENVVEMEAVKEMPGEAIVARLPSRPYRVTNGPSY